MRTSLALPVGLALALAPGRASADPPRVALRLEYVRGSGAKTCPAEPTSLRAQVAARMGYDPFEKASAPERLTVVIMAKGRGFAANVKRFNVAGASTWSDTFAPRGVQGDCEALMSPLATYLRALILPYQAGPAASPAAPPPKPTAPAPGPLPVSAAPRPQTGEGVRFGLGTVLEFGAAPRVAVGLSADWSLYWPVALLGFDGVSITPGLRWDPPAAGHVFGLKEGAQVSTSRTLITIAPCLHWLKLYGCVVGGMANLSGGGEGVAYSAQDASYYYVAGGRLGVEVPFASHLGVRVSGEVLGSFTTIVVPFNDQPGWTTPRASGSVGAGLYFFL